MSRISFEVFPPRTVAGELRLKQTLERLAPLGPRFVSVTCGAGGSDKDATFGVLEALVARGSMPAAGHLTCVGLTRAEIDTEIERYWNLGVRQVVALRGDVPGGEGPFEPHPLGYATSVELVEAIRKQAPFEVSVAAYPEPHPDSVSVLHDLRVLARKSDAGATRAITQFCFDTDAIASLRERISGAGIPLTVVPGILLTTDLRRNRADGRSLRCQRSRVAGRALPRPRRRSADAHARRCHRRGGAGRPAAARGF